MSADRWLLTAAVLGFLAVFVGAFGAHGLSDTGFLEKKYTAEEARNLQGLSVPASFKYMRDFETGVRYHMWHALALAVVALSMRRHSDRWLGASAWCFFGGIVLFSGSLYVLVMCGPRFGGIRWGMIAPIGGTLLLTGWGCLAVSSFMRAPESG